MPNIKSAKKRMQQNEKRYKMNLARKSAIKTAVKKVLIALKNNNIEQAKLLLREAEAKIARAKTKGVFHANTASRKVSLLSKKVAKAERSVARA